MKLEHARTLALDRPSVRRAVSSELTPKRWRRMYFYGAALAIDATILLAAFAIGNILRFGSPLAPDGLKLFATLLPIYMLIGLHRSIYASDLLTHWRRSAWRAVTSFLTSLGIAGFLGFALYYSTFVSREVLLVGAAIFFVMLPVSRYAMLHWSTRLFSGSPLSELLILDGMVIRTPPGMTTVDARVLGIEPDVADPHALDRLGRLLGRADRVVVACAPERRGAWAMVLKGANIRGELLTPEIDELAPFASGRFDDHATLQVSVSPLSMPNRALKRGLDLGLASAALLVLTPLIALVALAVKLDSDGPVFFVQSRLGRGNRLFSMYKFRSMHAQQCDAAGARSTARDDDRVTRIGRLIRATSVDELPQILNVLKGDMSFVGPRPHALGSLAGDKLFWEVDPRYWHRHTTKPGITGLAQVRGFRGATHAREDLVNRLHADLDYLNGWTIWRDVAILFATFRVVLHKNAY